MRFATVLVSPEEFESSTVEIRGDRYRHLFRARRFKVGDELRLVNGRGHARRAQIVHLADSVGLVEPAENLDSNEASIDLQIVVPVLRPSRLSWLVEKTTEIGVSAISFMRYERAPRSLGAAALDRLIRVAIAAVEQSNRAVVPHLSGVHSWESLPELLSKSIGSYYLAPLAPGALGAEDARSTKLLRDTTLLIGPEGGFSTTEEEYLSKFCSGSIDLGPRILRVETAAVVGAAQFLSRELFE